MNGNPRHQTQSGVPERWPESPPAPWNGHSTSAGFWSSLFFTDPEVVASFAFRDGAPGGYELLTHDGNTISEIVAVNDATLKWVAPAGTNEAPFPGGNRFIVPGVDDYYLANSALITALENGIVDDWTVVFIGSLLNDGSTYVLFQFGSTSLSPDSDGVHFIPNVANDATLNKVREYRAGTKIDAIFAAMTDGYKFQTIKSPKGGLFEIYRSNDQVFSLTPNTNLNHRHDGLYTDWHVTGCSLFASQSPDLFWGEGSKRAFGLAVYSGIKNADWVAARILEWNKNTGETF